MNFLTTNYIWSSFFFVFLLRCCSNILFLTWCLIILLLFPLGFLFWTNWWSKLFLYCLNSFHISIMHKVGLYKVKKASSFTRTPLNINKFSLSNIVLEPFNIKYKLLISKIWMYFLIYRLKAHWRKEEVLLYFYIRECCS